jgi:hypothetical protein
MVKSSGLGSIEMHVSMVVSKHIATSWELKKEMEELRAKELGEEDSDKETYEIVAYYHREFEAIREDEGIEYEQYVRSLTSAETW